MAAAAEARSAEAPSSAEAPVAVVTGGGSGIGAGISEALARSGYNLVLGYNSNRERCEHWAEKLRDVHGVQVVTVGGDLTQDAAFEALFKAVDDEFSGQVTAAVHNAGRFRPDTFGKGFGTGTLLEAGEGDTSKIDFNSYDFYSALYGKGFCALAERAAARMRDGHGYIVGITAPGCNHLTAPRAHYDMEATGKCVMEQMVRYYAKNLAPRQITCNCVMPGITDTPAWDLLADTVGASKPAEGLATKVVDRLATQRCPMKQTMQPSDVGNAVAFLCSPHARFTTGFTMPVDGGLHLVA